MERRKAQGGKFNAVDFLAGAMCAYFYLREQTAIPAAWILMPEDPLMERQGSAKISEVKDGGEL